MMITCKARNEDSSEEKLVAQRNTKWLVVMEKEEADSYRSTEAREGGLE